MTRVYRLMMRMKEDFNKDNGFKLQSYKEEFEEASKNRLEEEYKISKENGFRPIIDKNIKGVERYFGLISEECYDDRD